MTTVSAIAIGEELLDGRIHDKNAAWLGGVCAEHGATLGEVRVVGDDLDAIARALDDLSERSDLIVTSGGLGPTADDMTRDAAARWVGVDLELDQDVLDQLEKRFAARGYPFTPNNRRQCIFPEGADILPTEVGTAAAFALQKNDCRAVFLPGVPTEYRWFVETYIVPEFGQPDHQPASDNLVLFGLGESQLETRLDGIEDLAEKLGGRISYRPSYPVNQVHLKAPDEDAVAALRDFVLARLGKWLVAEGDESFMERVGALLLDRQATVTCAESCTAGRLAAKLTEVSGSSGWFERGFITYANAAKTEMLGVRAEILETFGAVSPQTVCQMAAGAREAAGATYALATSGIAGPTGGTDAKPVGTVHFALATPAGIWHKHAAFTNRGRSRVLDVSVHTALAMLLWHLEDRLEEHRVAGPFSPDAVWAPGGVSIDDRARE